MYKRLDQRVVDFSVEHNENEIGLTARENWISLDIQLSLVMKPVIITYKGGNMIVTKFKYVVYEIYERIFLQNKIYAICKL